MKKTLGGLDKNIFQTAFQGLTFGYINEFRYFFFLNKSKIEVKIKLK